MKRLATLRLLSAEFAIAFFFCTAVVAKTSELFGPPIQQHQPKSVPGGILFPNFCRAGEVNAASIPWDFGNGLEALYSPPLSEGDSHGVSGSFTLASSSRVGGSAGYTGSIHEGGALHGGFAGLAFRIRSLSFGGSVRIPAVDKIDSERVYDFSIGYKPHALFDYGLVFRSLGAHPVGIAGIGFGRYGIFNFEANYVQPLFTVSESWMARFQGVLAASLKTKYAELGVVSTYSAFGEGGSGNPWSYTAAATFWLSKSTGLKVEYHTAPTAYTIGIAFYSEPTGMGSRRGYAHRKSAQGWSPP